MSYFKIVFIASSFYIFLNVVLYFVQELLIFQSGKPLSKDYDFQFEFPFEEVVISPLKDFSLHGLLLKSANSKGVILYFHGNRGNVSRWGDVVKYFLQYDYDILVMDYRGYGKSFGERNENVLHSDARLAFDYLSEIYDKEDIVIYGRSLGTGIATKLASSVDAKCLILETPYKNLTDLMKRYMFIFPTNWLINYSFRSDLFLKSVKFPVHIFHGTNDKIVPFESGLRLVETTNRRNINFTKIDGGRHNNLHTFDVYNQEINQILKD